MKRLLLRIVMSIVLFCGTALAKTGEGMTIWFDTGGSAGDGYGTIVQNGAKAAAEDMGCELRLIYSNWNPETMLTNFRNAVASRPDGIVVMGHPGDAAFGPLIDAAVKQGIVVTSVDTALPGAQERNRAKGFGYVGTDNYTQGEALAPEVLRRTQLKKGDRAFVWGLKRIPDRGRRAQAIVEVLEKAGVTVDYQEITPEIDKDPCWSAPWWRGSSDAIPIPRPSSWTTARSRRRWAITSRTRASSLIRLCGGLLPVSGHGQGH
ncbi:MAG: substrate-binding domain-containing protein [Bilophila sp.]